MLSLSLSLSLCRCSLFPLNINSRGGCPFSVLYMCVSCFVFPFSFLCLSIFVCTNGHHNFCAPLCCCSPCSRSKSIQGSGTCLFALLFVSSYVFVFVYIYIYIYLFIIHTLRFCMSKPTLGITTKWLATRMARPKLAGNKLHFGNVFDDNRNPVGCNLG